MSQRVHVPELDLLRGVAAFCMVINHAGIDWGVNATSQGPVTPLVVIGEFAPVLFFVTTGIGHGLRPKARAQNHWDTWFKFLLLVCADWFIAPTLTHVRFDFLAFIGCAMLILNWVGSQQRAIGLTWFLLAAVVIGRFALGVVLRPLLAPDHWLLVCLGVGALESMSYWFVPWLAYPLLGYLCGHWLQKHPLSDPNVRTRSLRWVTASAALTALITVGIVVRGMAVYRWGTMSVAFFGVSLAAIACGSLFALAAYPRLQRLLAVSGTASFATVPLHYWLITEAHPLFPPGSAGVLVASGAIVLAFVVLELARRYDRWVADIVRNVRSSWTLVGVGLVVLLGLAALALSTHGAWVVRLSAVAQLLVCALLIRRIDAPGKARA